jgi:hypothetical protein
MTVCSPFNPVRNFSGLTPSGFTLRRFDPPDRVVLPLDKPAPTCCYLYPQNVPDRNPEYFTSRDQLLGFHPARDPVQRPKVFPLVLPPTDPPLSFHLLRNSRPGVDHGFPRSPLPRLEQRNYPSFSEFQSASAWDHPPKWIARLFRFSAPRPPGESPLRAAGAP